MGKTPQISKLNRDTWSDEVTRPISIPYHQVLLFDNLTSLPPKVLLQQQGSSSQVKKGVYKGITTVVGQTRTDQEIEGRGMMQLPANDTTMYQATTVNMDLDIVFGDGTITEPFEPRGLKKRYLEESEPSVTNNSTCNKRSRCDREGPNQGKGLVAATHNNTLYHRQQVGITQTSSGKNIPPQNRSAYSNSKNNNMNNINNDISNNLRGNNNTNNTTSRASCHSQFSIATKMNRCFVETDEYDNFSLSDEYGYRDH